jgi:hypothetical protein
MDSVEKNVSYPIKLIFADEVTRVVCVTMPYVSPVLDGTVLHKHAMTHYGNFLRNLSEDSAASKECIFPPLRSEFMSSIFPFVLPLFRDGTIITPTHDLSIEVHRFIDYMAGSNPIWCDFATYLSKPSFKYGIPFIPPPMLRVDHDDC